MKYITTVYTLLFSAVFLTSGMSGQIIEENFDYGMTDTSDITSVSGSWTRHSGTQGPAYKSAGLSYTEYISSGIGGSLSFMRGNTGDVHRTFSSISTTSDIYVSFMIRIDTAQATPDYFLHLGPSAIGTIFRGRIYVRSNGGGWSTGLSKSTELPVDDTTVLNYGQTYLGVLKYSFSIGVTSDDQVMLYIYDNGVPLSEPGDPIVKVGPAGFGTSNDPTNIGSVAIRQGTNTPTGCIDGIRIDTTWNEVPLPVQLISFSVSPVYMDAVLSWKTVTETDCYGFDVERREAKIEQSAVSNWSKVGFVKGAGISNSVNKYSFVDKNAGHGCYIYRLKQIDQEGGFQYFGNIEVEVGTAIKELALCNYPNPFNPTTVISFAVPFDGHTTLKVFSVLGREVGTLFYGIAQSGRFHTVTFDGANLASGVYYCAIEHCGRSMIIKMLIVK